MKLLAFVALLVPTATALWPIPSKYSSGQTVLWIGEHLQVQYNGANVSESIPPKNRMDLGPWNERLLTCGTVHSFSPSLWFR